MIYVADTVRIATAETATPGRCAPSADPGERKERGVKHLQILITAVGHAKAECSCGWGGRWHRRREDAKSEHGRHVQHTKEEARQ